MKNLLFLLLFCLIAYGCPIPVFAGSPGEAVYNTMKEGAQAAEENRANAAENLGTAMGYATGFDNVADGMADAFAARSELRFHVPIYISHLPPQITQTGVRCRAKFSGRTWQTSSPISVRDGGRTIILTMQVPENRLQTPGRYECSLWLKAGNGAYIDSVHIKDNMELDPSSPSVVSVRGDI